MAEEKHWLSQIKLGEWYSNAQYNYRPRNDKERNLMHSCYEEGYNNGFSNGLAEGKPKWHDLRKNPDDLPTHSGLYCVQSGEVREFVKEELSWFTVHFEPCLNRTEETYLWCELPKYKE